MAEELKSLLERIQKDGIDKAEAEAARVLEEAKARAESLVAQAGKDAEALLAKAEQDAKAFEERGRRALDQAARDVVLSVGDAVTATLQAVVQARVGEALKPEALTDMLVSLAKAYAKTGGGGGIGVLLSPEQQEKVTELFLAALGEEAARGVEIRSDAGIVAGFKLSLQDGQVQHDFTREAIAEALGDLLRPQIAERVRAAGLKQEPKT
jgi:V/A-type H+-transporting ATPase subunit E